MYLNEISYSEHKAMLLLLNIRNYNDNYFKILNLYLVEILYIIKFVNINLFAKIIRHYYYKKI